MYTPQDWAGGRLSSGVWRASVRDPEQSSTQSPAKHHPRCAEPARAHRAYRSHWAIAIRSVRADDRPGARAPSVWPGTWADSTSNGGNSCGDRGGEGKLFNSYLAKIFNCCKRWTYQILKLKVDKNSMTHFIRYLLCSEQPSACFMNIMKLNHVLEAKKRSIFSDISGVLTILATTLYNI